MKKLLFISLMTMLAWSGLGQGTIRWDSSGNTSRDPFATSNGQWWVAEHQDAGRRKLLNQDVNAQLFGGTVSGQLFPIATLLLMDHSADGDITLLGNGQFLDHSGREYAIPGSVANDTAIFKIEAWSGHYSSLQMALSSGDSVLWGITQEFTQLLGGAGTPAPGLHNMPALILTDMPEPGSAILVTVGLLFATLQRRVISRRRPVLR